MNGKELLTVLGTIDPRYYDEAENTSLASRKVPLRKTLLVAAIIAMTLLLVGCAVVYALRLQDMSIGKETYTQDFGTDGRKIDPIEKTRDVMTLYGHSGDPIQQALTEWFDFQNTYDPNGALMDNDPDHPEIPNQYEYTYGCYTPEMVEKVDEIAAKYGLNLLEEWIPIQAWQGDAFLEETGIGSFALPDSGAEITRIAGMYFPPYNFSLEFELRTDALDIRLNGKVRYARKDYFPRAFPESMDLTDFEQWNRTAPDGTTLLLARNSKGNGYIIAEQENAMLIYVLDGNFSGSAYPRADEIITKEQMEAVASVLNYAVSPQAPDRAAFERRLQELQDAHDAANTYAPETYGSFSDYLRTNTRIYDDALQYCFYDLTGDGVDDLLVGQGGAFEKCLYLDGGEVYTWYGSGDNTYVCENGIVEDYSAHEIFEDHLYSTPNFNPHPSDMDTSGNAILYLNCTRGKWSFVEYDVSDDAIEITSEEAQTIMARYPHVELNWLPLMEYPLSENATLGDYLNEKDVRLSGEALLQRYRDELLGMQDMHYSHYRILDINGDGVDDLLLKGQDDSFTGTTNFYWIALTYRYGQIIGFGSDFYLCENNVLERVYTRHAGGLGVEKQGHVFLRYDGLRREDLDQVIYNKSTAGWQTDWWDEEPISEAEAQAILAKYPRIDQGMRPISELLG